MELSNLAQGETSTLDLRDPKTGAKLKDENGPVTITLASLDSDLYRGKMRTKINTRISDPGAAGPTTAEAMESDAIDMLVFATVGWSNLSVDGVKDFSPELARKMYMDQRFGWIRGQVDTFLGSRANFIKASAVAS